LTVGGFGLLEVAGLDAGGNHTWTGDGKRWETELIKRITDDVVNSGDLAIVRDLFSTDYVLHKPGLSVPRGPEAFKMAIRQWREAFPDYRVTVEALFAECALVASRYVAEGTHRGSLLGVPPTEKSFRVTGTDVHRVADGMVVESWLADDVPRILTEVGVLMPARSDRWT
jgi:predicted ester cyclase